MDYITHTLKVQDMALDTENLWGGILASIVFSLCFTTHTTKQHMLAQLVFRRD